MDEQKGLALSGATLFISLIEDRGFYDENLHPGSDAG